VRSGSLLRGALLSLGVAACASPPSVSRAPAASRPPQPPVAAAAQKAKGSPPSWGLAYSRECMGSISDPVLAPSGETFDYCGQIFDLAWGAFLGLSSQNNAGSERQKTPRVAVDSSHRVQARIGPKGIQIEQLGAGAPEPLRVEPQTLPSPFGATQVANEVLLRVDPQAFPNPAEYVGLAFLPDGKTLFAWTSSELLVFRENQTWRPRPQAIYPLDPPAGFRPATVEDGGLSFPEGDSEAVRPGLVARMRSLKGKIDVWVYALDPDEFAPSNDAEAWATLSLRRYEAVGKDGNLLSMDETRVWRDEHGRNFEYTNFVREGCDPRDYYVRMTERDGILYRIVVSFPPGTPAEQVRVQLKTFLDDPFGDSNSRLVLAKSPFPSPC
jgi:hypothetical protein